MTSAHRIHSWNVNGIRACAKKGFAEWLVAHGGEIVALQETRAHVAQVPDTLRAIDGFHAHFVSAERGGYSGVGIYARRPFDSVETSLGDPRFDVEGRVQRIAFGDLLLVNGYFPNGSGKDRSNDRVPYKLEFYRALFDLLEPARKQGRPVLVLGDFNTAHRDIDLARPKANVNTSGFLPIERAELDRWLSSGWTDTFRHVRGDAPGHYTWWSQRFGVREKNIGWRIDYVLASPGALPYIEGADIHPDVPGSDHCPISVDVSSKIFGST
jgi:exodeoxyribonuclease III